jgi:methylated-DNA-[protein]-cysteine S-methyltransferase
MFTQRVYDLTKQVPAGRVSTYKAIAQALGKPGAAVAVGVALSKNPHPTKIFGEEKGIPCHRIIASDYSIGGFLGRKDPNSSSVREKMSLLEGEGIKFDGIFLCSDASYRKGIIFYPK